MNIMVICIHLDGCRHLALVDLERSDAFYQINSNVIQVQAHTFLKRGSTAYHAVYVHPTRNVRSSKNSLRCVFLPVHTAADYNNVMYIVATCDDSSTKVGDVKLVTDLSHKRGCTDKDLRIIHEYMDDFYRRYSRTIDAISTFGIASYPAHPNRV